MGLSLSDTPGETDMSLSLSATPGETDMGLSLSDTPGTASLRRGQTVLDTWRINNIWP